MINITEQVLFDLEVIIFSSIVLINILKKNSHLVDFYIIQSLGVAGLLLTEGINLGNWQLVIIAIITFGVKVFFAPYFFRRFIRKSKLNLLTSTHLTVPLTLVAIIGMVFLANSDLFEPLRVFIGKENTLAVMLISSIFNAIFILINRKGSLAQIIGILSLENTIVAIAFFLNITQTLIIEVGVLFDIFIWIVLAVTFIELIYRNLRTADISSLNKLNK